MLVQVIQYQRNGFFMLAGLVQLPYVFELRGSDEVHGLVVLFGPLHHTVLHLLEVFHDLTGGLA